ncbi:MAG: hypothetical protein JO140_01670 [Candidatus Eremiobacteraeota bacterium]|nr:hypothetical protein [Candidatus Eremiobacteraeota bacterium]
MLFNFDVGVTQTLEQRTSGLRTVEGANGGGIAGVTGAAIQKSTNSVVDRGTITADVMAAYRDGGLLLAFSEESRERRRARQQFGLREDGQLMTSGPIDLSDEERYLVPLLARGLMPEEHKVGMTWRVELPAPKNASDITTYKILGVDDTIAHLSVERVAYNHSGHGFDLHVTGTVDYDWKLVVPTAAKLHGILRSDTTEGINTVTTDATLSLAQDSFKK